MGTAITFRLDRELERQLDEIARNSGQSRSEIIREALRRHLSLVKFEQLRSRVMPFAEARGFLTDDDVFRVVS